MKGKVWTILLAVGFVIMLVQRIWFPMGDQHTSTDDIGMSNDDAAGIQIPYSSEFKSTYMGVNNPADDVTEFSSMNIESTAWNFFGYIRSGQYEKAALMFDNDKYMDFFFRNYDSLDDYTNQLNFFGNAITRMNKLLTVRLSREEVISETEAKSVFLLYYSDLKQPIKISITFKAIGDHHHDDHTIWFIADHPETIMKQFTDL